MVSKARHIAVPMNNRCNRFSQCDLQDATHIAMIKLFFQLVVQILIFSIVANIDYNFWGGGQYDQVYRYL